MPDESSSSGSRSTIILPEAVRSRLADRAPAVQDKYDLLEEIGRGGTAVVYRARHRLLGTQVAVKFAMDSFPRERFLREAQLMARIESSNVVPLRDFELLPGGGAMLVMDFVPGGNLHGVIASASAPADEPTLNRWMRETAGGMAAAAALGIVHRDLKPSNLLLAPSGRLMVTDFGMARGPAFAEESMQTQSGMILGTPHYMAPEQADDPHGVDTRADIYSFGATFYHAATGKPPFEGRSTLDVLLKHRIEPLVSPRSRREDLSESSVEVLERCLAKAPRDRFQSFDELLATLDPRGQSHGAWTDHDDDPALAPHFERFRRSRPRYTEINRRPDLDDVYTFRDGRTLRILAGRLETQHCDAIVSSDGAGLAMAGRVSSALLRAAGPALRDAARALAPVRPGRVAVTAAGRLPAKYVFHAVTVGWQPAADDAPEPLERVLPSRDLINELVVNCLFHADTHRVRTISFPLLGCGHGGLRESVCLDSMFAALARALSRGTTSITEARIVLFTTEWKPLTDLLTAMSQNPDLPE